MIFSKLNGLGNDFVITDDRENKYTENLDEMARKLCHRRTGIGADGLVLSLIHISEPTRLVHSSRMPSSA